MPVQAWYAPQKMAGTSDWDRDAMRRIRAHIRAVMDDTGATQNEVGARCGMSSGTLSKIMTNDRGIKVGMVLKLALGLGITSTKLLEENPDPKFFRGEPVPLPLRKMKSPGGGKTP